VFVSIALPIEIALGIYAAARHLSSNSMLYLVGSIPYIATAQVWTMQNTAKIPTTLVTSFAILGGQAFQTLVFCFALLLQLRKMTLAQAHADERARYAEKVSNMVRVLTHDLGNYIFIIEGSLPRIKSSVETDGEAAKNVGRVAKAIKSLREILQSVRELKAAEDGKLALDLTPVNLNEMLSELPLTFENQLREKNITVRVDAPAEREVMILAERRVAFHSILCNFVSNAIKFSASGAFIDIKIEANPDKTQVHIRDYGIGIPIAMRDNLFSADRKTNRVGTAG
jgi:signal transduction histidine kinase